MKEIYTNRNLINKFLILTNRNWRNSIYVECKVCQYPRSLFCSKCSDFLCVPSEIGTLIFIPVQDAEIVFNRLIDKSECLLTISNAILQNIYSNYFHSLIRDDCPDCPLIQAFNTLIEKY